MAEYIAFYTEEELTADMPLERYANEDSEGNAGISGDLGLGEVGGKD
jgi:hypothetical protein